MASSGTTWPPAGCYLERQLRQRGALQSSHAIALRPDILGCTTGACASIYSGMTRDRAGGDAIDQLATRLRAPAHFQHRLSQCPAHPNGLPTPRAISPRHFTIRRKSCYLAGRKVSGVRCRMSLPVSLFLCLFIYPTHPFPHSPIPPLFPFPHSPIPPLSPFPHAPLSPRPSFATD